MMKAPGAFRKVSPPGQLAWAGTSAQQQANPQSNSQQGHEQGPAPQLRRAELAIQLSL